GKHARIAAAAYFRVFNMCANAPEYFVSAAASFLRGRTARLRATVARTSSPRSLQRGRFVHIPHQLLESNRETAALFFREKPAHLTGAAMRLEYESTWM